MKNTKLVWSDDPKDKSIVEGKKGRPESQGEKAVTSAPLVDESQFTAIFRLEKGGRNGKTVTVIDGLPRHETYLERLTKELKTKCGVGGTHRLTPTSGLIEIQGDKREQIKKIFSVRGLKFKGM